MNIFRLSRIKATLQSHRPTKQNAQRSMAVYAMGHGWTGALGTGGFEDHIKGHDDEEEPDPPHLLYDGDVLSAAADGATRPLSPKTTRTTATWTVAS